MDLLNAEKSVVMQQASSERGLILSQEKKMALCEICGSFLVANDATERTQSHMTGKQHVGFGMVRDYLVEYKVWTVDSFLSSSVTLAKWSCIEVNQLTTVLWCLLCRKGKIKQEKRTEFLERKNWKRSENNERKKRKQRG